MHKTFFPCVFIYFWWLSGVNLMDFYQRKLKSFCCNWWLSFLLCGFFFFFGPCHAGFSHLKTFTHTPTHLAIPRCSQSNFCRCSDPWNDAKSISFPQQYVKAADCLIQPQILTLGPTPNAAASRLQYPQPSWKQAASTTAQVCALKLEKFAARCVCVCVWVLHLAKKNRWLSEGMSVSQWVCFKDKYCTEEEIIHCRALTPTTTWETLLMLSSSVGEKREKCNFSLEPTRRLSHCLWGKGITGWRDPAGFQKSADVFSEQCQEVICKGRLVSRNVKIIHLRP